MAIYAVGDVQGCFRTLEKLLLEIKFDTKSDKLIFLGDVINRGPNSLEVIQFIKKNTSCMEMVLGNHEIFAIALALDAIKSHRIRPHTLQSLLSANDKDELINFLRAQPFIIKKDQDLFVHAGILPSQDIEEAIKNAHEISTILQSDKAKNFLERFFEKIPSAEKPNQKHKRYLRLTLSALIFLRMCESPKIMNLDYSGTIDKAPKRLNPWFKLRNDKDINIYFGHWAALGLYHENGYYCLDSGCVWGNKLTALRLEDKKIFQVNSCENS